MRDDIEELEKILESLKKLNKDLKKDELDSKELLDEAFNERAKISIEKFENGRAETSIEGSTLGILILLAGLEKTVLEHMGAPEEVWESIKQIVGTKEAIGIE